MHYAEFAEDESQALLNAIKEYENNKWKTIGSKVGKPAKVGASLRLFMLSFYVVYRGLPRSCFAGGIGQYPGPE